MQFQRFLFASVFGVSLLLGAQTLAQAGVGKGSCSTGTDPCVGNTGNIGKSSCNGDPDPVTGKGVCEA